MTDPDPAVAVAAPAVAPDVARLLAEQAAQEAREAALRPANKDALFEGLRLAGIAYVIVSFDGYGDSGQIEEIDGRNADGDSVQLPPATITFRSVDWQSSEIIPRQMTLEKAIEHMAYDFLSDSHGGWENNDGAYGEFCFDAREGTIHLDYNERFTSSEYFGHDF